jgi:hypothetical protein
MNIRNSQTPLHRCNRGAGLRHRVHVAGIAPNHMNRFLDTNMQEVLFVI